MKTYRLIFSAQGAITKIPDAQTVFGALCAAICMYEGVEKMEDYIHSLETDPWFVHSSMFPLGLFPACSKPLISVAEINPWLSVVDNGVKLPMLSELKRIKKYQYMSQSVFENYYLNEKDDQLKTNLIQKNLLTVERVNGVSILKDRTESIPPFSLKTVQQTRSGSNFIQKDNDLFYQKQMFLTKESRFCLFVKSSWSLQQLNTIFSLLEYTGIGPHRSSGLNLFRLEKAEEVEYASSTEFAYLLSGCIPKSDEFLFDQSYYQIDSATFRSSYMDSKSQYSGTFSKLKEGSLMKPIHKKEWYGQMIPVEMGGRTIVHYGLGVVL